MGGGEDTRYEQSGESHRQLTGDVKWENLVRAHVGVEPFGMGSVIDEQRRADAEEQEGGDHGHDGIGPDGTTRQGLGFGGHVPLHHGLVRRVRTEILPEGTEDDHPDRHAGETVGSEVEVRHAELVIGGGSGNEIMGATVGNQQDEHQQSAAEQYKGLHRIRPDDRLDAAHHAVDDAQQSHDQHALRRGHGGDGGQRQRGQCHHHRHAEQVEAAETGAAKITGVPIEPLLQILIRRGDVNAAEEGQGKINGNGRHADNHEIAHHINPVLGEGLSGDAHEGQGTEHGGEDGTACRPPHHVLAAPEILVRAGVFVGEIRTQRHHRAEVNRQHGVIQHTKSDGTPLGPYQPQVRRTHAGTHLAGCKDDAVIPLDRDGADLVHGRFSHRYPGVGDGVIGEGLAFESGMVVLQFLGLEKILAVIAAQHKDVALSPT